MSEQPEPTKVLSTEDVGEEATIDIGAAAAAARTDAQTAVKPAADVKPPTSFLERLESDFRHNKEDASPAPADKPAEPLADETETPAEKTVPVADQPETDAAEAERQAEEARIRQEERAAREKALGSVAPAADDVTAPAAVRHANDKFVGSMGLFLLRLVLAAVLGVRGVQVLFNIDATNGWLTSNHVPRADLVTWGLGILLLIIAAMLVVGLGVRVAGILTAALAIALLVFIRWGYAPLFTAGQPGFLGDWDVLVAGVGLALAFLGSGGWAIDGAMRFNRAKRKAAA